MPKTRKVRPLNRATPSFKRKVKLARAKNAHAVRKVKYVESMREREQKLAKASAAIAHKYADSASEQREKQDTHSSRWFKFQGSNLLRHRLLFATLMHRPIQIENIRQGNGGLNNYEMKWIELLDKITNGSVFEIDESGTMLRYKPGSISGNNRALIIDCPTSRGLSYWIEPLLLLLPFAKEQSSITLRGSTYHELDLSIDVIRGVLLPLLKQHYGMTEVRIDVRRRGVPPLGGGEIHLSVPLLKQFRSVQMCDVGMIKKIRGLCYTVAMAPTVANRVRVACNEELYHFISDVWIFNDRTTRGELQKSTSKSEVSAGYGLSLIAESTSGVLLSVAKEALSESLTAEDFGKEVSRLLLEEVSFGGTVDSCVQSIVLCLMAMSIEDVSKVRLGRLTPHSVALLRLIRETLGVTFKLKEDPVTGTIFASCVGMGYRNVWRQAT